MSRCNLCNGDKFHPSYKKNGFQLLQCDSCGLTFVNPTEIKANFQQLYDDDGYFEERVASEPSRLQRAEEQLQPILARWQEPGKLLDCGSGLGFFMQVAARNGWEPFGVEISQFGVDYARKNYNLPVFQGTLASARDWLIPPFRIITFLHVLEHVPDPMATLKLASEFIEPGGGIVIEVPDYGSAKAKRQGSDWHLLIPPEHLYYFDEKTLKGYFEKIGFGVTFVKKVSSTRLLNFTHSVARGKIIRSSIRKYIGYLKPLRQVYLYLERLFGVTDVIYIIAKKPVN